MHRPECAEIVGVTGYDLNRAAYEMTAIQQAPAQVLMLQSVTSQTLDFGNGLDTGRKLYTALSFTGLKIGFVTERQLEAGFVPQAPVVFISGMVHMFFKTSFRCRVPGWKGDCCRMVKRAFR